MPLKQVENHHGEAAEVEENYELDINSLPGIRKFPLTREQAEGIDAITSQLEIANSGDVRIFHGSPLHRKVTGSGGTMGAAWIRPAIVQQPNKEFAYHLIYVNCLPENAKDALITPVLATDIGIKLRDAYSSCHADMTKLLAGKDGVPRIVVRRCQASNPVYPHITFNPNLNPEETQQHIDSMGPALKQIGIDMTENNFDSTYLRDSKVFHRGKPFSHDLITIYPPRKIRNFIGEFFVYDFVLPHDPWKIYQVITITELRNFFNKQQNFKQDDAQLNYIRLDSGCDCGQLYGDTLCDCSPQLFKAMEKIMGDGQVNPDKQANPFGLIIHIPTQDGRGLGMAIKAEAECYKGSFGKGRLNGNLKNIVDPLEAIKHVVGEDAPHEIRTFEGALDILMVLGLKKFNVISNNRDKLDALSRNGDMHVQQESAVATSDIDDCHKFVKAKLRTVGYIFDEESTKPKSDRPRK